MDKVKIGFDCHRNKEIFKLRYSAAELPKLQLFNTKDVAMGSPMSNIAIAFIYTWDDDNPPSAVQEFFLRVSSYAYLTGYWKTTNGAKYVFSNILGNPNVNKLVLLVFGKDDNGHNLVDCLCRFWQDGLDQKGFVIGSSASNPRFEGVPPEALDRLRKQADLVVLKNLGLDFDRIEHDITCLFQEPEKACPVGDDVLFFTNYLSSAMLYDDGARFEKPYQLDLIAGSSHAETRSIRDVSAQTTLYADDLDDAIQLLCRHIYKEGQAHDDQRRVRTFEARSFSITIKDALARIPEGYSKEYLEKYTDELLNGGAAGFSYTYHQRIFERWGNQVEKAINLLKRQPSTRRCLISLWDPAEDLDNNSPPCMNLIWLAVRKDLEMHVVFRSHHLATITKSGGILPGEGAFVPNIHALASLHDRIAQAIGIVRGPIVLTDFSGHLYTSDLR